MSSTKSKSPDIKLLRHEREAKRLMLENAELDVAVQSLVNARVGNAIESYFDADNYVDLRDYLVDGHQPLRTWGSYSTRKDDREEGRNYPIFRTEQELAQIRGVSRILATCNNSGVSALERLTDYVIRTGFDYQATGHDEKENTHSKIAQKIIDDFLKENCWCNDLDRELFARKRRDGERMLGLWHQGGGHVQARVVEPDNITEPSNKRGLEDWLGGLPEGSWTFGVHADLDDVENVHGYYVQWSERETDWDYLPGGQSPVSPPDGAYECWLDHAKVNVDRNIKRGLSDFFCLDVLLDLGHKLLRNTGHGGALQAAIAWIKEVVPGTTQQATAAQALANADAKYQRRTASGQTVERPVRQYEAGTILTPPAGTKYVAGPLGAAQSAPNFIGTYEAIMRSVATRWGMREDMVTGSAANNNYASILVAGDPFVVSCETKQQAEVNEHETILWRVLYWAWQAGRFGGATWADVRAAVQLKIVPPQVAIRDRDKETNRRKLLFDAGILSAQTWAAEEDLDHEQEVAAGAKPQFSSSPFGQSADVQEDCGTGAGGFQAGNSCAADKGGGFGGKGSEKWKRVKNRVVTSGTPATHSDAESFFDETVANPNKRTKLQISLGTADAARKLRRLTGLPLTDSFSFTMQGQELIHILKRHGETADIPADEVPVTKADIVATLAHVVNEPDQIVRSTEDESTVIFKKRTNGTIHYVQAVHVNAGELAAVTMLKKKRQSPARENFLDPASGTRPYDDLAYGAALRATGQGSPSIIGSPHDQIKQTAVAAALESVRTTDEARALLESLYP
jgi:hypothetical protein